MKYRKKPVVIEAEVYQLGMEDGFDCLKREEGYCPVLFDLENKVCPKCDQKRPYINTLEGYHYISPGDYIITGIKGEHYPCKPDIFAATYEPVEEVQP